MFPLPKPKPRRNRVHYIRNFRLDGLLALAAELRGRPCTFDESKHPSSGCFNWVIFLTFDDGLEWVFRSPELHMENYAEETASKSIASEVATLRHLRAHTSVPVPEVYSFSESGDNLTGVPYILQSKAAGRPLSSYDWFELPAIGRPRDWIPAPITDKDRVKVMQQLGSIMSELTVRRFDTIGSMFQDENGEFYIGESLAPSLTWEKRDALDLDRGPFKNEHDYLLSLISALALHSQEMRLSPHMFNAPIPDDIDYLSDDSCRIATERWNDFVCAGNNIGHSKNALNYSIASQILREMIPQLCSKSTSNFTLSHPDLRMGNLFVDEDFNITCIIDWSSATVGPISELLAAPLFGLSSHPPADFLRAAFRSGFCERSINGSSKTLDDFPWATSEKMYFFAKFVRLQSKNDYALFKRLYQLVYGERADESNQGGSLLWLFHQRASREENQPLIKLLQEDDLTTEEVQEEEARKLTLMSEMNPGFLADHRLWRWVEEARKDEN